MKINNFVILSIPIAYVDVLQERSVFEPFETRFPLATNSLLAAFPLGLLQARDQQHMAHVGSSIVSRNMDEI
jgi:hypothetical protein